MALVGRALRPNPSRKAGRTPLTPEDSLICQACGIEAKAFTSVSRAAGKSVEVLCRICAASYIEPAEMKALERMEAGEDLVPVRCSWEALIPCDEGQDLDGAVMVHRAEEVKRVMREELEADGAFRFDSIVREIRWATPKKLQVVLFYHLAVSRKDAAELEARTRGNTAPQTTNLLH